MKQAVLVHRYHGEQLPHFARDALVHAGGDDGAEFSQGARQGLRKAWGAAQLLEEGLEIAVIPQRAAWPCRVAGIALFGAVVRAADAVELRRVLYAVVGAWVYGKLPVDIGSVLPWDGIGDTQQAGHWQNSLL